MNPYPDGATLVPDLSGTLKMALGYAMDQRDKRETTARQQEVSGLAGQLGSQGLKTAISDPEAVKTLTRMAQLDPNMAQFTVGLLEARDANALKSSTEEMNKAGAFYQGVLTLKPEERRDALLAKAGELKDAGQPYEQLLEMAGQDSTQQEIGIRRKLVLNGQFQALAGPSLKEQLDLQNQQLTMLKTQQEMLLSQDKNQRDADAAARAAEKAATDAAEKGAQKSAAQRSMQNKALLVGDQLKLATEQMSKAWSGHAGRLADWLSPTGDTAKLRRTLDTITSNIGFGELMRMKAESPTGGALGSVSERELSLLNATLGNLDALQSDEELYRVLNQVHSVYDRISRDSGGEGLPPLPALRGGAQPAPSGGPPASAGSSSTAPPSNSSGGNLVDWGSL